MLVRCKNILTVALLSLILSSASNVFAAGASLPTPSNYVETLAQTMGGVVASPQDLVQSELLQDLLGSEGPSLNMPNFPRIFAKTEISDTISAYANLTLKVNTIAVPVGVNASAEVKTGINYEYTIRSAFFAISSLVTNNTSLIQADGSVAVDDLLYTDKVTQRNAFNVSAKNPMVGFCFYELQLNRIKTSDKKGSVALTLPFASATGEVGLNNSAVYTMAVQAYSRIFQIERGIPEMEYTNTKCMEQFNALVKRKVESTFAKKVNEYWGFYNPDNQCQGTSNSPSGDVSCKEFFDSQSADVKKTTVARCERQYDGLNKCVLKSKQNVGQCALYKKKGGGFTTRAHEAERRYGRGSSAPILESFIDGNSRPCDARLSCVMTQEKPWGPFGFLFQNIAKCI